MPVGPYTKRLKTLGLKHNFFIEIPHSLAGAAPELRKLDISHNLLRPSETDIETVLQLPSLEHLWVTKVRPAFRHFVLGHFAIARNRLLARTCCSGEAE